MSQPMDHVEMRALMHRIGWDQDALAYFGLRDASRVRKMTSGRDLIDQPMADWLRAIEALVSNPPWKKYERKGDQAPPPNYFAGFSR